MVSDERGQLILVGAIALALILLGLVVVVNTALFTQVVGSEGTTESVKEGGLTGQQIGDSVAEVVAQENLNDSTSNANDIDDAVRPVVADTLNEALRNRSIEAGGTFTNVSYDSHSTAGTVVEQSSFGLLIPDSGPTSSWEPIPTGQASDVGAFRLSLQTSTLSSSFGVTASGTGGSRTVSISPNGSNIDISAPGTSCTNVSVPSGIAHFDLLNGNVFQDSTCQYSLIGGLEPGYSLEFSNGNSVIGTYQFVTNTTSLQSHSHYNSPVEPEATEAVWAFNYSYTYDTPPVTVESESTEVEVYD